MAIQYFDNGQISRDTNIVDPENVYLTKGQGCDTIWFDSVPAARAALAKDGIKTGADLADCKQCRGSHSIFEKDYEHYASHLCEAAKLAYAKHFSTRRL